MNILDIVYRNILPPESLREKRRNDQVNHISSAIDTILNTPSPPKILTDDDIQETIREIMNEKVQTPSIRGIMCKDDCSLLLEKDSIIMSVPLLKFGLELATVFEEKLTSTALCFIADASSGLGTKMLGEIVSSCGAELVSYV
jgi:hypothetical protein